MPYERHQLIIFVVATLLPATLMRRHRSAVFWYAVSAVGVTVSIVYVVTSSLLAEGKPVSTLAWLFNWVVVPIGSLGLVMGVARMPELFSAVVDTKRHDGGSAACKNWNFGGLHPKQGRGEAVVEGTVTAFARVIAALVMAVGVIWLLAGAEWLSPMWVAVTAAVLLPAMVMQGRTTAPLWCAVSASGVVAFVVMANSEPLFSMVMPMFAVIGLALLGLVMLLAQVLIWLLGPTLN